MAFLYNKICLNHCIFNTAYAKKQFFLIKNALKKYNANILCVIFSYLCLDNVYDFRLTKSQYGKKIMLIFFRAFKKKNKNIINTYKNDNTPLYVSNVSDCRKESANRLFRAY